MLTTCSECKMQISDMAVICPHCGCPQKPIASNKKSRHRTNRRRRLPNGFGQISEIKNKNLRKPFRVMVPVGKTSTGRPISKPLKPDSYFVTYNEAYAALLEYHSNPYDLSKTMTMQELFDKWLAERITPRDAKTSTHQKRLWKFCSEIYGMRVDELRIRHIKGCLEHGVDLVSKKPISARNKMQLKGAFNQMLDYAVENELANKNYARSFHLPDEVLKEANKINTAHIPFSDSELNKLWDNLYKIQNIDILLIQCYSGWRPGELCDLKVADVDVENWSFVGGIKTDAGRNRFVPIHTKIRPLVLKRYNEATELGSDHLFNYKSHQKNGLNRPFSYNTFKSTMSEIVLALGLNVAHRPHDGRKHFVTMAKKYNVDEYAIKYMVGHVINDITEKVYTQREKDWLYTEIEKIQ